MLTDLKLRAAVPKAKDYKLFDSGGLHLFVTTKGRRTWRLKYRLEHKEYLLTFGSYPEMSLADAREARDEAKKVHRAGRDPRLEAKRLKLVGAVKGRTFEEFAREWHEIQTPRWKPVHAHDVIDSLVRDIFPQIGAFPLAEIDEPLLLAALKKVEKRGAIETARRLRQRVERIFRYAKGTGAVKSNPAIDVKEAMLPLPSKRRWPAIIKVPALSEMIRTIDAAGASPVTRLASRFLGLVAQRPGMVRGLMWTEIEGVNWVDLDRESDSALWRIPAGRMKQELHLRDDAAFAHEVPLSRQAVETLRAVRSLTGRGPLAFCSNRDAHVPMSENAIGYLYNRNGYQGLHVPHGWRSSFSTVMNGLVERQLFGMDRLVIDRLIIDLMLAHSPAGMSISELIYNRAAYMPRRREIAQQWADLIMAGVPSAYTLLEGRRRSALG